MGCRLNRCCFFTLLFTCTLCHARLLAPWTTFSSILHHPPALFFVEDRRLRSVDNSTRSVFPFVSWALGVCIAALLHHFLSCSSCIHSASLPHLCTMESSTSSTHRFVEHNCCTAESKLKNCRWHPLIWLKDRPARDDLRVQSLHFHETLPLSAAPPVGGRAGVFHDGKLACYNISV